MPSTLARFRVEAKPGLPLPFGLLNAATLTPVADVHEELGVDWFSLGCGPADLTTLCDTDDFFPDFTEFEDSEKTFSRPEHKSAPPVTVYAGVECAVPGWTDAEGLERARANLNIGEQAALEKFAWAVLANDAIAVSLDGDGSIVGALGELEQALTSVYTGVGVLHVPSVLASYLSANGLTYRDGSRLRTLAGHYVSIGAGYPGTDPDGDAPPAGQVYMMISGPVTIRQGEIQGVPGNERASIIKKKNDRIMLAERTNVIQYECGAFAVPVEKRCCSAEIVGS